MAVRLSVKVVPGSTQPGVAGWLGDALKIRVAEPPEKGRANAAVAATLAASLGLTRGEVRIVAGHGSARKIVEIDGLAPEEIRRRLGRDGTG
jgi:uncharacterized protein YggU (UPF0235/DUF167 family)